MAAQVVMLTRTDRKRSPNWPAATWRNTTGTAMAQLRSDNERLDARLRMLRRLIAVLGFLIAVLCGLVYQLHSEVDRLDHAVTCHQQPQTCGVAPVGRG